MPHCLLSLRRPRLFPFSTPYNLTVTGRLKTGHSWAPQTRPPLVMVSPHYGDVFCLFYCPNDQLFFVVQIFPHFEPMGAWPILNAGRPPPCWPVLRPGRPPRRWPVLISRGLSCLGLV